MKAAMRSGFAAGIAGVFVCWPHAGPALAAEPRVQREDFHGWRDCWRMSNGKVDLVFVPQVGRIMRFGRVDGPNVLWENPDLAGKRPDPASKDWTNFGGDKLWPAPQERWGWPPDTALDPGEHTVEALPGGKLRVTGKSSFKHGIKFIREFALAPDSPEATVANIMVNMSDRAVDWSLWEVAQVNDPAWAEIPIDRRGGWNLFDDPSVNDRGLSIKGSISRGGANFRLTRDSKRSGKIGTDSSIQWARARVGGDVFAILGPNRQPGEYPDKGSLQEIYSSADPAKYMELELLSPIRTLKPGARVSFVTRWRLDEAKGD
jgi:hypothetical protein